MVGRHGAVGVATHPVQARVGQDLGHTQELGTVQILPLGTGVAHAVVSLENTVTKDV